MGDVAQILKDTQPDGPSKAMKMTGISKEVMTLLGGNKQDALSAALPPIMPTLLKERMEEQETKDDGAEVKVKVGNKWITSSKPARPWTWAPFASSSRTDGAMFRHWVRANVEYTDYPYAKFDIHLDPVIYSEEEYANYLQSDSWTKTETDKLMELARKFELRWAVIHDRWLSHYSSQERGGDIATRKVEDLQERYYTVAALLSQVRITQEAGNELQALASTTPDPSAPDATEKADQLLLETAAARALATAVPKAQPLITNLGTGTTNKLFDAAQERERRAHLDRLWKRSKEEEQEELELRKELREIETQLRKLKKSGGHVLAAASNRMATASSAARNVSRSVTPIPGMTIVDNPELLNQNFVSNAPVPMPQNPYLQSGRLAPPAAGGSVGLNKTMLTRMQQVLNELKIPPRPLPTKRVCDMYDSVRKDVLILITLQKMVMQKEGTLHAKRVKLYKLGGGEGKVLDEEELLGIAPPPPPPAPAPAPATAKKAAKPSTSSSSTSKPKTPSSGSSKPKAAPKPKTGDDAAKKTEKKDGAKDAKKDGGGAPKKPSSSSGTKRKRKPDAGTGNKEPAKKPATQASAPSGTSGGASTTPPKTQAKVAPLVAKAGPPASAAAAPTPAKTPKSTAKAPAPADSGGKRARKP